MNELATAQQVAARLLTRKQVAEYLGMSLYVLDAKSGEGDGQIPRCKHGRWVRYDRRDVQKWLRNSKHEKQKSVW